MKYLMLTALHLCSVCLSAWSIFCFGSSVGKKVRYDGPCARLCGKHFKPPRHLLELPSHHPISSAILLPHLEQYGNSACNRCWRGSGGFLRENPISSPPACIQLTDLLGSRRSRRPTKIPRWRECAWPGILQRWLREDDEPTRSGIDIRDIRARCIQGNDTKKASTTHDPKPPRSRRKSLPRHQDQRGEGVSGEGRFMTALPVLHTRTAVENLNLAMALRSIDGFKSMFWDIPSVEHLYDESPLTIPICTYSITRTTQHYPSPVSVRVCNFITARSRSLPAHAICKNVIHAADISSTHCSFALSRHMVMRMIASTRAGLPSLPLARVHAFMRSECPRLEASILTHRLWQRFRGDSLDLPRCTILMALS